jgi:hypothetical protein
VTAALRTARAWSAVHAVVSGASLLATSAALSAVLGRYLLYGIGPISFVAPVSVLLLIPVLAGTAVAIACHNEAGMPLPDPARAKLARAGWALVWTVLATAASNTGQFEGAGQFGGAGQFEGAAPSWQVVARNVLLLTALSLAVVVVRVPNAAWLPPVVFVLLTMLFGSSETGSRSIWWSVLLRERTSPAELGIAAFAWAAATIGYAACPTTGMRAVDAPRIRPVISRTRSRGLGRRAGRAR